ncbi:Hypothetical protein GOX2085 [Gluconobacter oxydans 621H]|uniref:Uncharacterized protein n=1 Tax=Gluconobacter oxydans (strain 621H) TaxID=290633 RepID=Q5FP75_GLUOX|nr:Hypothetical protein GOX2085 [Gluconobacter oxydans 621H]
MGLWENDQKTHYLDGPVRRSHDGVFPCRLHDDDDGCRGAYSCQLFLDDRLRHFRHRACLLYLHVQMIRGSLPFCAGMKQRQGPVGALPFRSGTERDQYGPGPYPGATVPGGGGGGATGTPGCTTPLLAVTTPAMRPVARAVSRNWLP